MVILPDCNDKRTLSAKRSFLYAKTYHKPLTNCLNLQPKETHTLIKLKTIMTKAIRTTSSGALTFGRVLSLFVLMLTCVIQVNAQKTVPVRVMKYVLIFR